MEKSDQFTDYLFAKMGPSIMLGSGDIPTVTKTTGRTSAALEMTGFRKWINKNYLLLMTLFGVVAGIILGKHIVIYSIIEMIMNITFHCRFQSTTIWFKCRNSFADIISGRIIYASIEIINIAVDHIEFNYRFGQFECKTKWTHRNTYADIFCIDIVFQCCFGHMFGSINSSRIDR